MNKLFYLSLFILFFITHKSYAENICPSGGSSNTDSGTVYDSGGANGYYSNYDNCGFLIQPSSSPTSITLSFSQFTVETNYDFLYVYDGTSASGTFLGKFTGGSLPNNVTATSGSMYLRFISDYSYRYQGFTASWTSVSVMPELIASYNFDDDWVVNSSLTDQTGSYNGSPGGSVSRVLTGASSPKGDTCYAGSFAGGAIDITGLPVSTATGAKTSVSFWMYWDGTNNIMPMGWYKQDLWLINGSFGFNTWNNDLMGVTSSGLSSGWHHVVAIFTNGSVSNNKLYFDGVLQTISSQGSYSAYLPNATVQSALRIGGLYASTNFRFMGQLDNFKIYTGEISQAQVTVDMNKSNACPGPATPILEYKFDACSLASTVEDTQGNYDGIATSTDSTGSTSVLGGRSLDLSATDTSDWVTVPKSVVTGLADFSFSVWIKTGTSTLQQEIFQALGSSIYDDELEIYLKYSNTIILRLKDREENLSAITALTDNTWHHLVLTRENDIICLYVDGSQTDCDSGASTGTLSVPYSNAVIIGQEQDSIRSSASLNTGFVSTQSFKGYIDELKIYDSVLNSSQVQTLYNNESSGDNTSTCSGSGGDTPATNFNCVENSSNGISGKLYTKTTAQSFNFDIVALQDASTIETGFASGTDHTVTVELVNAATAASCNSYPVLSPAVSQSLLITASDTGTKASANMSSSTAYSKIKCRVTDASASPSIIGCSTDSFAIRPTEITLSSNLTYDISTQTPKAKAGENFTLTATTTAGYNGTPSINNSIIQAHTDAIQMGSISGVFSVADSATGIATGSTFNYSEVGLLRFPSEGVLDDNFTVVDHSGDCTDDFSNTPVAGKVGCKFGNTATSAYFGRFTPDHFDVTLNTPVFSPSCSTFTYLDQPIKYTVNPIVTLIAKNSAGVTTQNYTGDYWKINPSGFTPVYTAFDYPLTALESNAPTETDNGNGTGLLSFANTSSDILKIKKGSLTAPVDADIALSFNLIDTDSITIANVNDIAQVNPVTFGTASVGNGISFSGDNKSHRWGRVSLGNTHGSELTPLSVPLYTEYFNGNNFIKNTADNCTTFSLATDFSISDANDFNCSFATQTTPVAIGSGSVKASLLNSTLITGESELIISDNSVTTKGAGAGNTGYVDITSKLTNLPWLLYDWDGNTVNDNCPTARATFGIYKGNEKQIYFREVY